MLLLGLFTGVAFGFIIQRVGASQYDNILKSLLWRDITIIKFMAVAITTTLITSQTLALWIPMHFAIKPLYVWGVLLGGLIFGVGFALAGYCPGTAVVGMAERKKDAVCVFLGGMVGVFIFIKSYGWIAQYLIMPMSFGKLTWPVLLGVSPITTAWGMGILFCAVIYFLPTVPKMYKKIESQVKKENSV
mgnify:CR=1 FL=1